jgi:ferredoxin
LLWTDDALGLPVTLLETINTDWPKRFVAAVKAPPRSRRDFFRALTVADEVPANVQQLMQTARPDEGQYPPSERTHLLRAISAIPRERHTRQPLDLFQSSLIAADEKCTACGICERACPTGAMGFLIHEENRYQLTFNAGSCTGCGVCLNLCDPGALQKAGIPRLSDWLAEEPITLRHGELNRCRRCGATYDSRSETELCAVCDYRKRNPFGSRLPKGFVRQKEAPKIDDVRH